MAAKAAFQDHNNDLNLKATELRLGLPGTDDHDHVHEQQQHQDPNSSSLSNGVIKANNKRSSSELDGSTQKNINQEPQLSRCAPARKTQVVGWPPVRSFRKNALINDHRLLSHESSSTSPSSDGSCGMYVKVSMDGAPYLRKIDLKCYKNYSDLLMALENMFQSCNIGTYSERDGYNGSEHVPAYEDKDGDWMLVGDVPWDMFVISCKRLRIMKGSEAKGLGCF